ncbi:MAG: biopolymer transporter ExbD [Proteobacteria bacterium]|jgi:biopolymer transport protein ExbD|nr:biopolymer transporter ExbD [Pseudomonadota bacterium]
MQFYTRKRRSPFINIVSLIDILAILLIFFIVTTNFRKPQPQLQINLPDSKSAEASASSEKEPAVLRVKSEKEITLDDKPVTIENLTATLQKIRETQPSRGIAMQADREAPFGTVVKILDSLKAAGLRDVPTFTQPESSK